MKKILRIVVVLLLLVVVALIGVFFYIDSIAKTAIEEGGTFALGTKTTLTKADVQPINGRFEMAGLEVGNPSGFQTPHFMELGSGALEVSLGSLMGDTVEIPELSLDSLEVIIEKKDGDSNLDVIMGNLGKLGGGEGEPAPAEEGEGKRFKAKEVKLTNINVKLAMLPVGTVEKPYVINVPEILIKDLGSDSDKGILLKDLMGTIIAAVMRSVVDNAGGALPAGIMTSLDASIGKLGKFGEVPTEMIGDLKNIGVEKAGEMIEGLKDKVPDGVKDVIPPGTTDKAKDKLNDLLGGNKKDAGDATKDAGDAKKDAGGALDGIGGLLGGEKKDN